MHCSRLNSATGTIGSFDSTLICFSCASFTTTLSTFWRDSDVISVSFETVPTIKLATVNIKKRISFVIYVINIYFIVNLWDTAKKYISSRRVQNDWLDDVPENWSFTAYFEIFYTPYFKSKQYRDFSSFVDDQGGLFSFRWTDGVIQLLAMAAGGLSKDKILCFGDYDDFIMHVKTPSIALDELKDPRYQRIVFNYKSKYFENANESLVEHPAMPRHLAFQQLIDQQNKH